MSNSAKVTESQDESYRRLRRTINARKERRKKVEDYLKWTERFARRLADKMNKLSESLPDDFPQSDEKRECIVECLVKELNTYGKMPMPPKEIIKDADQQIHQMFLIIADWILDVTDSMKEMGEEKLADVSKKIDKWYGKFLTKKVKMYEERYPNKRLYKPKRLPEWEEVKGVKRLDGTKGFRAADIDEDLRSLIRKEVLVVPSMKSLRRHARKKMKVKKHRVLTGHRKRKIVKSKRKAKAKRIRENKEDVEEAEEKKLAKRRVVKIIDGKEVVEWEEVEELPFEARQQILSDIMKSRPIWNLTSEEERDEYLFSMYKLVGRPRPEHPEALPSDYEGAGEDVEEVWMRKEIVPYYETRKKL